MFGKTSDNPVSDEDATVHAQTDRMIKKHLAERHWDVTHSLSIDHTASDTFFDASTNNRSWKISVNLSPEFEKRQGAIVKDADLTISDDPVKVAIEALLDHEYGHWDVSPQGVENAERVLNSVATALRRSGFDESQVRQFGPYVSNMYMDVLVNGVNMESERFREGHTILDTDRAYFGLKSKNGKNPSFEDYFAMFVDAQGKLTDADDSRKLAEKYSGNYSKIKSDSERLLASVIGNELARKAFINTLTDEERQTVRRVMKDETRWENASYEFTKIVAPYIKNQLKDVQQNVCLSPLMAAMVPGPGDKEDENGQNGQDGGKNKGSEGEPMPGDLSKGERDEIRKEMIAAGLKRIAGEGGDLAGIGAEDLPYATRYEVFDQIYKQKANEIVVDFLKEGDDAPRTTLFHMAERKLGENEGISSPMAWDRTIFVDDDKLWLYKKKLPFDMDSDGSSHSGSFENILFVVDVSGSMAWSGRPLDESPYDMCIRSIYAIVNYLEKANKAQYIKYGLMLFSNSTTWSGWVTYGDLKKLKEQIFTGFENGGTELNPETLQKAIDANRDRFLTLLTSDGDIMNADDVLPVFQRSISKPNDVVMLQMGGRNYFGKKMQESGAAVMQVDGPEDLVGLNLSIIDSKYGANRDRVEIKQLERKEEHSFARRLHI